jgi:hypothetical protein
MSDSGQAFDALFADKPAPETAPAAPAPEPTPQAPPAATQPEQAAEVPQPAQPVSAEPAPAKREEAIPLRTALDWRDEAKANKARVAELEAQLRQPQTVPSVQDDPEAFAAYQTELVNRTRTNTIFDVSETMATEKYGAEPVQSAMEWAMGKAQASPAFASEYLKQKHPIDWAVKQQRRETLLNEIGDDPDAYVRRRAAELAQAGGTPPQPAQPSPAVLPQPAATPATPAPRPSLASAPTAGGMNTVPIGPGAAFDAAIRR